MARNIDVGFWPIAWKLEIIVIGVGKIVDGNNLKKACSDPAKNMIITEDFCEVTKYLQDRFNCHNQNAIIPLEPCITAVDSPDLYKDSIVLP